MAAQLEEQTTPRIAGVGLLTPLGASAWATFSALLGGRRVTDVAGGIDAGPGGHVPLMDFVRGVGSVSLARHTATDPAVELAERAAREAIAEAGVEAWGLPTYVGCSKGAVTALAAAVDAGVHLDERQASVIALGPHGFVAAELERRLNVEGRGCFVAACASGLCALEAAWRDVSSGAVEAALVVSAEAALEPVYVRSYQRLGVLAEATPGGYRQRPLAQERAGVVLAEAGAAVVLTRNDSDRGVSLRAMASASDAHDMLRADPAMSATRAVTERLVAGRAVSVVHPHAPGTRDHDAAELRVVADVLREGFDPLQERDPVSVYANKGALGHALGASGLSSVVIAALVARTGKRPPMPWLAEGGAEAGLGLPIDAAGGEVPRGGAQLVLASGFGGGVWGALLGDPHASRG